LHIKEVRDYTRCIGSAYRMKWKAEKTIEEEAGMKEEVSL
jgi:hypothetical protein